MTRSPLFTIGYEGRTLDEFLDRLGGSGAKLLIDVRAIAASRRPGFSKTALAGALAEVGIDYLHLRSLGTPKAGREAARKGRADEEEVPAFVVFSDATLQLIAELKPTSTKALLGISGIGPQKLEKYGDDVLQLVS